MTKPLVIVESPAKARTIGKFLGRDYVVKASMGHVRDLPKSALGVDPEKGFVAEWETIGDRAKILKELRESLSKTDTLYLATDPDREGEAIAWHLVEALVPRGKKDLIIKRVVFHEITDRAIKEAFEHPAELNLPRVDAYKTRRILDRLMGYQLSPLLWKKLARGLSAGRVQSVAVRLVVEREREIRAFVPEEYWKVTARFAGDEPWIALFARLDDKARALKTQADADEVMRRASGGPLTVSKLEAKAKTDWPKPPFITSTLQQSAASWYGFAAARTMRLAQNLYEGVELPGEGSVGLITYMRTDSFNVSTLAQGAARKLIGERYGAPYVPEQANLYRSKKGAQEAHEAIRPTDVFRTPDSLRGQLKEEHSKLYDLVWRRFVASQMTPARYDVTTVELARNGAAFDASGRKVAFDGYTRVWGREGEDPLLPALREGQQLTPEAIEPTQHFTQPPRRYSESSLVRALEKFGIGRPSTYASILSTIVDRGYVDHGDEAQEDDVRRRIQAGEDPAAAVKAAAGGATAAEVAADGTGAAPPANGDDEEELAPRRKKSKAFFATHLGEVTTDMLVPFFDDIVNTDFTARLEDDLDRIADGQQDWQETVSGFYDKFSRDLGDAEKRMEPYWKRPQLTEVPCGKVPEDGGPACTTPMAILFNKFGPYLGCSRYPACKNIRPLSGVQKASSGEPTEHTCRKRNDKGVVCGRPMEKKVNRWGSAFLACTGFKEKECDGTVSLSKAGEPLWPVETSVPCPDCGTAMSIKRSLRGRFLACPRFPKCRGTLALPTCTHAGPKGGKPCGKPMTEPREGGLLACPAHPEVVLPPPPRRTSEAPKADGEPATDAKRKPRARGPRKKAPAGS